MKKTVITGIRLSLKRFGIMSGKVADQLIEIISESGIKRIYGIPGNSLNEISDAVRRQSSVKWINVRNEETGAFAAAAEAELNGIACCAGSSGPGHVHLVNGLYNAHKSNAAVLAIATTIPSNETGTSYFQETNTLKLFDDCSAYNQIAYTPVQFPRMLQSAIQHAVHKKDVAVIGIPADLSSKIAVESSTTTSVLHTKTMGKPEDFEIRELATLINDSNKITLFCGIGSKNARDEVIKLASLIKSPVAYTFKSRMYIQHNNPYEIGMTGILGLPAAFSSMHESDLIIMLGTDFPYESFYPDNIKIVQVDIRPERIGRRARVDMALHGDVKNTIKALLPLIEEKNNDNFLKKQIKNYSKIKENLLFIASKKGNEGNISPEYITMLIDNLASKDAVFTVDTGMCCIWGSRYLTANGRREMIGSYNYGSMANAMPMAIGAAFARPDQQIVALCGDGGLSMLLGDLSTIVQYKLPVKIILFNNRSLGMVKLEMQVAGLNDWQTDLYNPDFAGVAKAMGMTAFSVKTPEEAEEVLKNALKTKGPVLVDIAINPNSLAMPPKIELKHMAGYASAMTKLLMSGREGEVWEAAKTNIKHIWGLF